MWKQRLKMKIRSPVISMHNTYAARSAASLQIAEQNRMKRNIGKYLNAGTIAEYSASGSPQFTCSRALSDRRKTNGIKREVCEKSFFR